MLKLNKNNIINISLILFWILCWLSLNLNPEKIHDYNFLNQLRIIMPLITFFLLFIFYAKFNEKKNKFMQFKNFIPFYIILISYFIFSINNLDNYYNFYWIIIMLFVVFVINFFEKNIENLNIFLIISLFFLVAIFAITLTEIFYKFIVSDQLSNFYGFTGIKGRYESFVFLEENLPRATGISRISLLLFICCSNLLFFLKLNKTKIFFILLSLVFGFFSLAFQSRTVVGLYFCHIFIFFILYYKKIFNHKLIFILLFLAPIMMSFLYQSDFNYKNQLNKKGITNNSKGITNYIFDKKFYNEYFNSNNFNLSKNLLRKDKNEIFKSTRYDLWRKALRIIKNEPYIGHGIQADRSLISDSVHSSVLYILLCGGLLGFIGYLILLYFILLNILKFFKLKKFNNYFHNVSICFIILILARSVFETSFAIMSIDFLVFIVAYSIVNYYGNNKNKYY